ncbi:MAG: NAD(P)-binding protein, partial [bacterium]
MVGAGPAGLRFAGAAARRGHRVRVIERHGQPGGRLAHLAALPGRSSWQGAIDNLLRPVETGLFELQLGVSDEAGVTALREADHRVLAIGAAFDATGYSAYRPDRSAIPSASGRMLGIDQAIDIAMSDP